eukprot:6204606-Pleurochrysis_carterae.AAC.1
MSAAEATHLKADLEESLAARHRYLHPPRVRRRRSSSLESHGALPVYMKRKLMLAFLKTLIFELDRSNMLEDCLWPCCAAKK